MTKPVSLTRYLPATALVVTFLIQFAHGNIVVNYDKDTQTGGNLDDPPVVESGVELGGVNDNNDERSVISLADNDPNPWSATAGDYNGTPYKIVWEGIALGESATWDSQDSNPLSIRFQTNSGNGGGNLHLAWFFETAGSNQFDATSSMSVDFSRTESLGDIRWLVRDNGTYYLSQSQLSGDTTFDQSNGLLTENWAVYDIASGADFDQGSAVYNTSTSSFTSMDAFGIMADKDAFTESRHWMEVNTFHVDAIPEPGVLALLGLALPVIAYLRRHK